MNEKTVEYYPIANSPFTIAEIEKQYWLMLGKWKLNDQPLTSQQAVLDYIDNNTWNLVMKVASCVTFDMVKPVIQMEALKAQGVKVNEPEIVEIKNQQKQ